MKIRFVTVVSFIMIIEFCNNERKPFTNSMETLNLIAEIFNNPRRKKY